MNNSYIKEILEKNYYDIQKEVPIKSSKSFLFEYWNIFFYLYSKKYLEIFKQKNSKNYDKNILDSLTIDDLLKNNQSKEIDSNNISGNLFNSLSNNFSFLNGNHDPSNLNINNQNLLKNLFQQQNNNTNNNFPYPNIMSNLQNNLYLRNFPTISSINNSNLCTNNLNNNIKPQSQIIPNINYQPQPQIPIINNKEQKNNLNKNTENNNKNSEKNKIKIKPKLKLTTLIKPKPGLKLFVTKVPKDEIANQLINRKRRRFIKNKKLVFIPTDSENINQDNILTNDQIDSKDNNNIGAEKLKHNEEISENDFNELLTKNLKPRGSKYRGVSRNGSQWQVLIMVEKKKRYVGSFSNEEEAARAYDKVALQHHGIKAKTNFDYSKEELENILNAPHLLKLD